jgi:predicted dehydrogenase
MERIRWGIIGVGDVNERKSGPAFYEAPHSELAAVMRRNSDKARDYAERHGVPKWYNDGEALIVDPDVDAVYISTPPDTHKEYTLKVAATGNLVSCEKPMARNFTECREMIEACSAAGIPLWVAFYRRSMPRFLKIKELLEDKAIGDVIAVSIRRTGAR